MFSIIPVLPIGNLGQRLIYHISRVVILNCDDALFPSSELKYIGNKKEQIKFI